jgi:7-keto-8-aminopelargonate synthetase-like enzyme
MQLWHGRFGATIDQSKRRAVVLKLLLLTAYSLDGVVAPLDKICDPDKYDMVMVDECHATGFIERQEKEHLRLKE